MIRESVVAVYIKQGSEYVKGEAEDKAGWKMTLLDC